MSGSDYLILIFLLFLRIFNGLTMKTFFQPDEYWQVLEPAHKLVFGYGYLTWEWREGIRSIALPLLYTLPYKLLQLFGKEQYVVLAPKVFQSLFAALGDFMTFKLGTRLFGIPEGRLSLFCSVISAFNWFCYTRTFSNSLETVITAFALYFWPGFASQTKTKRQSSTRRSYSMLQANSRNFRISLSLAAVACIFRPTNALLWFPLTLNLFHRSSKKVKVVANAAFVGLIACTFATGLDTWYYQRTVFTIVHFLKFNLLKSLSVHYGWSPWHYYLSQGVPLLLTSQLPFALYGWYQQRNSILAGTVAFVLICYSLISHKEVRFIYPLSPILLLFSAKVISSLTPFSRKLVILWLILTNIPAAYYFSQVHQRGLIDVMKYLRTEQSVKSVGFLMPCHSTPWQSHLHRPEVDMWFLTCEPPLNISALEVMNYRDEADQFFDSPLGFLEANFPPLDVEGKKDGRFYWPSHLLLFQPLQEVLTSFFHNSTYHECKRFFNSDFHDDPRRKGDILLFCHK